MKPAPASPNANPSPVAVITSPVEFPALHAQSAREEKTWGEKAHRFTSNILINHVLNLALGFWFARASEKGNESANPIARGVFNISEMVRQKLPEDSFARNVANLFWLSLGGHLLVPIIKWMNDDRLPITQTFDRWKDKITGHEPDEAERHMREAAYARLAQKDQPGWGKIWFARISGVLWNMGTEMALNKLDSKLDPAWTHDSEERGYGRLGKIYIDARTKKGATISEKHKWWAHNIPLEVLSTINAVGFFNLIYDRFDRLGKKKEAATPSAATTQTLAAMAQEQNTLDRAPTPEERADLRVRYAKKTVSPRSLIHAAERMQEKATSEELVRA